VSCALVDEPGIGREAERRFVQPEESFVVLNRLLVSERVHGDHCTEWRTRVPGTRTKTLRSAGRGASKNLRPPEWKRVIPRNKIRWPSPGKDQNAETCNRH